MKNCFLWLQHPNIIKITNALTINNKPSFQFVGGCVRDSLLGKSPIDFDIASSLHPEDNIKLLQKNNIKVINFALSYGTIIARLSEYSFEITTLRIDTKPSGRHSEVAFSNDYFEDAQRRDFTINALYLNPITAKITDYFNGLNDLKNGKIRFIGNINTRIKEDYLRILRFIRFYTVYGKQIIDQEQIQSIKHYASKLLLLSKERITAELNKIINHNNAPIGIKLLNKTGITTIIFKVPYLCYNNLSKLNALAHKENIIIVNILKWLAIISSPQNVFNNIYLTKKDRKYIRLISSITHQFKLKYKISYFLARYNHNIIKQAILLSLSTTKNNKLYEYLNDLLLNINLKRKFKFCIDGNDLIKLNLNPDRELGAILLQLKEWGIENNINTKHSYINKAKELINKLYCT